MERSDLDGDDVIISICAREECISGKNVAYYAKDERRYYALHYIVSGKGLLVSDGKEIPLKSGDLFIIPPSVDISYIALERWEYYWVNVEGKLVPDLLKSIGLDAEHPRVNYRSNEIASRFIELVNCYYIENDPYLRGKGMFYLLMGDLYNAIHDRMNLRAKEKRNVDYYIREAITFLKYNLYYSGITLDSVAKSVSVNKNYLCTIFRQKMGVSPMQYLIQLRMEAAAQRFKETDEPIAAVAKYVGYKDPLHFSKAFHSFYGMSPTQYRGLHVDDE